MLMSGMLCNDANLVQTDGAWRIKGDPTEGAFVVAAAKAKLDIGDLRKCWPRIGEIPFESERKRMSTVHQPPEGEPFACVKGAPELILERCTHWERNGQREALTEEIRQQILDANDRMAKSALRVLGLACRSVLNPSPTYTPDTLETDLTFLGLAGMIDPPREEVKKAIRDCQASGIRTVMVTGDHKLTAAAIARELGILGGEGKRELKALEGRELDKMSEEQLADMVEDVAVYARVSPEHKMKIVGAWKSKKHVVAMTGDGVNDAPALKRADIGVAMGITGTDVTKEASDMVLMDDNFATIVAAVEEGRIIYDNIKKYLTFLLSCNVAEILVLGMAGIMGWPMPLVALQILWVNLTTDGLPALALGVEPAEPDLMGRPPRDPDEPVFARSVLMGSCGHESSDLCRPDADLLRVLADGGPGKGPDHGSRNAGRLRAVLCLQLPLAALHPSAAWHFFQQVAAARGAVIRAPGGGGDLHPVLGHGIPHGASELRGLGRDLHGRRRKLSFG